MIDARTLLHLVADNVDISSAHQLVAPNLLRSHALSLLFAAVRDGEITEDVALKRHERITEIKIRLLGRPGVAPYRVEDRSRARVGDNIRCGVPRRVQATCRRPHHDRPRAGRQGCLHRATGYLSQRWSRTDCRRRSHRVPRLGPGADDAYRAAAQSRICCHRSAVEDARTTAQNFAPPRAVDTPRTGFGLLDVFNPRGWN